MNRKKKRLLFLMVVFMMAVFVKTLSSHAEETENFYFDGGVGDCAVYPGQTQEYYARVDRVRNDRKQENIKTVRVTLQSEKGQKMVWELPWEEKGKLENEFDKTIRFKVTKKTDTGRWTPTIELIPYGGKKSDIMRLDTNDFECFYVLPPAKKKNVVKLSYGRSNARTVKPGDTFRYSFQINMKDFNKLSFLDDGVSKVFVTWKSEGRQKVRMEFPFDHVGSYSIDERVLNISGKLRMKNGMQPGKWKISEIRIVPYDLYYEYFLSCEEECLFVPKEEYEGKSFASFQFQSKVKADIKAPVIRPKDVSVSKRKNAPILRIKVRDASEITKVECNWQVRIKGKGFSYWMEDLGEGGEMTYNPKRKCFELKLENVPKESYICLCSVYVRDVYGNARTYYNKWQDMGKKNRIDLRRGNVYGTKKLKKYIKAHPEDMAINEIAEDEM